MRKHPRNLMLLLSLAGLLLAGCVAPSGDPEIYGSSSGGTIRDGAIRQEGSSTVLPIAERWAEDFGVKRQVDINVGGGGSGRGATGLCNGELDIGDMSRELKDSEKEVCQAKGIEPVEWWVAFDGLSVVVSKKNTFVNDLSVEQLDHIFRSGDHATRWNQVDPTYPDRPIQLCYPDEDSGTYEYFNDEILDGEEPRRGDGVSQSSDDNVIVRCLQDNADAIGYFGFAYLLENEDSLRAVSVEGVAPSFQTISDGSYSPLGRPIYMYTNGVPTGLLGDYFHYAFHPEGGQSLVRDAGYVELDEQSRLRMLTQLEG